MSKDAKEDAKDALITVIIGSIIGSIIVCIMYFNDLSCYQYKIKHAPKVALTAMENDLNRNAMNAKAKYEGNIYVVNGIVNDIDANGEYISLKSLNGSESNDCMRCHIEQCTATKAHIQQIERISAISVGDTITVKIVVTEVNNISGYETDIVEIL